MDQLRVRCPACEKLYLVDTSAIYSHSPHFDCKACNSIFSFEYPVTAENEIGSEVLAFLVKESSEDKSEVILQAQPSLVQLWNRIIDDYEDRERHDDFIKRCRELEALPFAKMKYQDLRGALGEDEICTYRMQQIDSLINVKTEILQQNLKVNFKDFRTWVQALNWRRMLYWMPGLISIFMVLLGFSNLALRNMIGVGMATGFLSYGLISFFRGRIRLSDFLD